MTKKGKIDIRRAETIVGRCVQKLHAHTGKPMVRKVLAASRTEGNQYAADRTRVTYQVLEGPKAAYWECERGDVNATGHARRHCTYSSWSSWAKHGTLVTPARQKKMGW